VTEIGDGTRDFEDAVMRAGAQAMRRTAISNVLSPASSYAQSLRRSREGMREL